MLKATGSLTSSEKKEGLDSVARLESAFPIGTTFKIVKADYDKVGFDNQNGSVTTIERPMLYFETSLSEDTSVNGNTGRSHIILASTLRKIYRVQKVNTEKSEEQRKVSAKALAEALNFGLISSTEYSAQLAALSQSQCFDIVSLIRNEFQEKWNEVWNDWNAEKHPEILEYKNCAGKTYKAIGERILAFCGDQEVISLRDCGKLIDNESDAEGTVGYDLVDRNNKLIGVGGSWITFFARKSDWEAYKSGK